MSPPGYSHIRSVHAALQGREAGKGSSLVFSHSVQDACTLARCVDEETSSDVFRAEQPIELNIVTSLQGDISWLLDVGMRFDREELI